MQVQDIVREYSYKFCKDLVRPLQQARVLVGLYPSVCDVVSISAQLGEDTIAELHAAEERIVEFRYNSLYCASSCGAASAPNCWHHCAICMLFASLFH